MTYIVDRRAKLREAAINADFGLGELGHLSAVNTVPIVASFACRVKIF